MLRLVVEGEAMKTVQLPVGPGAIHPEVEKISGLIPATVEAKTEYRDHVLEKQRKLARSSAIPISMPRGW